ncbi:MAG: hypothetical protein D6707_01335, partial [Bacteroidetes bacterium]
MVSVFIISRKNKEKLGPNGKSRKQMLLPIPSCGIRHISEKASLLLTLSPTSPKQNKTFLRQSSSKLR